MQEYAIKFGVWYSGMPESKVKTALERFEREDIPATPEAKKVPPRDWPRD